VLLDAVKESARPADPQDRPQKKKYQVKKYKGMAAKQKTAPKPKTKPAKEQATFWEED